MALTGSFGRLQIDPAYELHSGFIWCRLRYIHLRSAHTNPLEVADAAQEEAWGYFGLFGRFDVCYSLRPCLQMLCF